MSALVHYGRRAAHRVVVHQHPLCLRAHRLAQALALALVAGNACAANFSAGSETELIQAVNDANTSAGADTIDITADITLNAALPVITESLTLQGSGGVNRSLVRDDSDANACAISASNAFRLIDASADLTLRNLTLNGGCNLTDAGGAARVSGANLVVEHSTISGNHTVVEGTYFGLGGLGGGLAVIRGDATITESTISGNATDGAYSSGGGVAVYVGNLMLTNSTVSNNASNGDNSNGGGVFSVGDYLNSIAGNVTISNAVVTGNQTSGDKAAGGGLYSIISAMSVSNSRFSANQVMGGAYAKGGGIWIGNRPDPAILVSIERTTISANTTTGEGGEGGGIYVEGGAFQLDASSVTDNVMSSTVGAFGGGIELFSVPATLINSTISGNRIDAPGTTTAGRGGGIHVYSFYAYETSLSMFNSTIAGNTVNAAYSRGGGVRFQSYGNPGVSTPPSALFESTIIAGNSAADGSAIQIEDSPFVVANHCLIQGTIEINPDIGGMFTPDATTTALLGMDPLLQPLAYNGGPTMTQALAAASPALDQGTNTQTLAFDQRGAPYARVAGTAADIGAYELDLDRIFANGFD